MRFILALIPPQNTVCTYLHAAQMLFGPAHEGYLLSEKSAPHITVVQFECDHEDEALYIYEQVQKRSLPALTPRFTGVSFIKGVGVHREYYWAELSVAREEDILSIHKLATDVLRSQGLTCLNDCGDLYRPHLLKPITFRLLASPLVHHRKR